MSYFPPQTQLTQAGASPTNWKFAFNYVMTQMSAKDDIRKHGKAAEEALMKEFQQLEALDVYEPVHAVTLTKTQCKAALRAINLVKENRCGTLKGRIVADGRPQRTLYDKSETALPTVSTDALMFLSIIIDVHEGCDVAIVDIAGAYLKAYMKDFVIMKFTEETLNILCKMNPKHRDFVTAEGNTPLLYVRLINAIYGCMKFALLWYKLFSTTLQ